MRHPALTRFFAAFLAVMSAITMFSGAVCIRKAAENREKQNTTIERLAGKNAEARRLRAELDAMPEEFEVQSAEYDESKERYDSEKNSYRKDLSIYTATESALQQAQEKIDEGYAALRMGWIQHDNGEKKLDEAEAQFRPGYEQYLAGKAQLEEGRRQLAEAEKLKESMPDPAIMRSAINELKASRSDISVSLNAIQSTLENPPLDPDTGEVDEAAQRAQLRAQLFVLSGKLAAIQATLSREYGAEVVSRELSTAAAALSQRSEALADGNLSEDEMIAAARQILASGQSLTGAFDSAIASAERSLSVIESIPALKAQLDAAEAKLKEAEPALLQAKQGFDEGRKQLDAAKQQLIWAEAQLISGTKELEEKRAEQEELREDLERRKTELEEESERLEALLLVIEDYRDKRDRFSNLRYALTADEGIGARVRAGEDLIDGTEEELAARRESAQREYELRMTAAILMLAAALCGLIAVISAFRNGPWRALRPFAFLGFACSAAAEGVSLYADRGVIYTALFVGVFGAAVLALNLKMEKKAT